MSEQIVPVVKDDENERPVPTIWRPVLSSIVNAFVESDFTVSRKQKWVSPISKSTAKHIENYINDYGEVLIPLPKESWGSSVCIWTGRYWNVLVDLWTQGEGHSDLVLAAEVYEKDGGYLVKVGMVYVP